MKRKLILLVLACSTQYLASEVKLTWDAPLTTGITNYVIYAHTNVLSNTNLGIAVIRLNVGTNLTATIPSIQSGFWSFGATSMKDGLESDLSNVINVEIPKPPILKTIVIQRR